MTNAILVSYGALLVHLGLTNDANYGARCIKAIEYPVCMISYFVFWLCFFGVCVYFYKNNFWMDEEKMKQKDDAELQLEQRLLEVGTEEDRAMLDADGDGKLDKLQIDKDGDGIVDEPVTNS
jgi:hypothetical protein